MPVAIIKMISLVKSREFLPAPLSECYHYLPINIKIRNRVFPITPLDILSDRFPGHTQVSLGMIVSDFHGITIIENGVFLHFSKGYSHSPIYFPPYSYNEIWRDVRKISRLPITHWSVGIMTKELKDKIDAVKRDFISIEVLDDGIFN